MKCRGTNLEREAVKRERPSVAFVLFSVMLGAAMFGFTAAGAWYLFCMDHGEPEAAAAFADLAPPPAVILLASLGLVITVGVQLQMLRERAHADEGSGQSQAIPDSEPDVRSCVAPLVGVSDEPVRSSPPRSPIATS